MMIEIRLTQAWQFNEETPLGKPGGFGAVFQGQGASGEPVAVKRLFSAYQPREIKIADYLLGHNYPHVIPILDAGYDEKQGRNFIVMPRAEQSLQDVINLHAPFQEAEALDILSSIADGLMEIGELVHRDIKPANILLHHGVWKIADLGLARFVEDSTSLNTMKEALSPPYAAPEQWRIEHSTKAVDVYAVGCIIYALVQGKPPFPGPTIADYNRQHQLEAPPKPSASPHIRRLAMTCLAKAPEARPSTESLASQIRNARSLASQPKSSLAQAAATIAERRAAEEERTAREKKPRMAEKYWPPKLLKP
jgi:serine/threonine protein kinase